jgi:hypothetical protein
MPTFLFCCPNTGLDVQAFTAEEIGVGDIYETVHCIACERDHLVNLNAGRVVGADERIS